MQVIKRKLIGLLLLAGIICMEGLPVHAEAANILWAVIDRTNAVLYLPENEQIIRCQVGTVPCAGIVSTPISELEIPIHTLIILDNSLSIPKEERPVIGQLLTNLIGNRMEGETFTIATIEDEIHFLCTDETDYLTLSSVIDNITYENQDTQLTDNIYRALETLKERLPLQFSRVVVVSDGVDDKEVGYTHAELEKLIGSCGYPIYTVGCGEGDRAERKAELENLFSLSRISNGQSFYLNETKDTHAVVQAICAFNMTQQVIVPLPEEVCDGTIRAIMVQSSEGEYTAQLTMPFGRAQLEPEEPELEEPLIAQSESAELEVESDSFWEKYSKWILLATGGTAMGVVIILGVFLVIRHKKNKKEEPKHSTKKSSSEIIEIRDDTKPDSQIRHWYDDLEQYSSQNEPSEVDQEEGTLFVFNGKVSSQRILRLTSMMDNGTVYELPLREKLVAGRSPACQIVLEFPSVSRRQCEFFQQGEQVLVRNLSQTNGTQMDGVPIQSDQVLNNGSILRMGNIEMKAEIL